jgi:chemotaxis protein CheZ
MPVRRKIFRIEETNLAGRASPAAGETQSSTPGRRQVHGEPDTRGETCARCLDAASKADVETIGATGLRALRDETDTIHRAITRTRQEIATLHANGFSGMENGRVFRELDAVVGGAEQATQQILAAAEEIDEAANNLSALLKRRQEQALAQDIRDQVIRIFEACNFQDLAGQRISAVVATLKFVEDHVARMIEIWGGIEAFKDYAGAATAARHREPVPANGPKLAGDRGHASQDEIDALFAPGISSQ